MFIIHKESACGWDGPTGVVLPYEKRSSLIDAMMRPRGCPRESRRKRGRSVVRRIGVSLSVSVVVLLGVLASWRQPGCHRPGGDPGGREDRRGHLRAGGLRHGHRFAESGGSVGGPGRTRPRGRGPHRGKGPGPRDLAGGIGDAHRPGGGSDDGDAGRGLGRGHGDRASHRGCSAPCWNRSRRARR